MEQTTVYLRERITRAPAAVLVLGSGLGALAGELIDPVRLPYRDIPGFPASTVEGHEGALVVAPPSVGGSTWLRRFGDVSTAFASGWMRVRGARRRRSVDRGFVISDQSAVGGATVLHFTEAIAHAFLTSPPTLAQRIARSGIARQ